MMLKRSLALRRIRSLLIHSTYAAAAVLALVATSGSAQASNCANFECPKLEKMRKSEAARFAEWYIANGVKYDQNQVNGIDCTGFVSRVWGLGYVHTAGSDASKLNKSGWFLDVTANAASYLAGKTVRAGDYGNPLYLAAFWILRGTDPANYPFGHAGLIESIDAQGNITTLESKGVSAGGPQRARRHVSQLRNFHIVVRKWEPETGYNSAPPAYMPNVVPPNKSWTRNSTVAGQKMAMTVWRADQRTGFGDVRAVFWSNFGLPYPGPQCATSMRYWKNNQPIKPSPLAAGNANAGLYSLDPSKSDFATVQFFCNHGWAGTLATARIRPNGVVDWFMNQLYPRSTF